MLKVVLWAEGTGIKWKPGYSERNKEHQKW